MMVIEDQSKEDKTIRSKNFIRPWGKDPGSRGPGPNPQKRGVRGGSQKSPNFAHGGGKSGGGFFGGVPKNRGHKTWSFMKT